MKVLMFGAGFAPSTFIQRQMDTLKMQGIETMIVPKLGRVSRILRLKAKNFHLPKLFLTQLQGADVFHYQWPTDLINYYVFAEAYKKPAVISLRGRQVLVLPHVPGYGEYVRNLKKYFPLCQSFHCVSEMIMREGEKYGLETKRAWIIRPAVDTAFFSPDEAKNKDSQVRIAMVGGRMWAKGYVDALMAIKKLSEQGMAPNLTIFGKVIGGDWLQYTIKDLHLNDRVAVTGHISAEDVRKLLRKSHIFLLASLTEGISNAAVEAMACGLPIVTTNAGGMTEVVNDGEEGFVIPLRDVLSMAERLRALIENKNLRVFMGEKARKKVIAKFELNDQGRYFAEMYRSVLR